jgi:hypothetical protein
MKRWNFVLRFALAGCSTTANPGGGLQQAGVSLESETSESQQHVPRAAYPSSEVMAYPPPGSGPESEVGSD